MVIYRITERDRRFIVGTEQEAVLICRSLDVAHQAVADAELLETQSAKLIFSRRVVRDVEERETSEASGKGVPAAGLFQHDGQHSKNPPPVLPDESSAPGKNICLSER